MILPSAGKRRLAHVLRRSGSPRIRLRWKGFFLDWRRSLCVGSDEINARTERRRRFSDAEKAAILDEADQDGVSVREVAKRQIIAESIIYNSGLCGGRWRLLQASRRLSSRTRF